MFIQIWMPSLFKKEPTFLLTINTLRFRFCNSQTPICNLLPINSPANPEVGSPRHLPPIPQPTSYAFWILCRPPASTNARKPSVVTTQSHPWALINKTPSLSRDNSVVQTSIHPTISRPYTSPIPIPLLLASFWCETCYFRLLCCPCCLVCSCLSCSTVS